jgi:hypothetical protein
MEDFIASYAAVGVRLEVSAARSLVLQSLRPFDQCSMG